MTEPTRPPVPGPRSAADRPAEPAPGPSVEARIEGSLGVVQDTVRSFARGDDTDAAGVLECVRNLDETLQSLLGQTTT